MTELITVRDKVSRILHEYETWFLIIAKFIGMMFVFSYVNSKLGYFEALDNILVNILLSLICSIIPGSLGVFLTAVVILAHMAKLSIILAAVVAVVMLILYLLFLKFAPGQSIVLLAVPVLMQFNLHFMVPVAAAVFFTPYAVVPAVVGMFMVKFLGYTVEAAPTVGAGLSFDLDAISKGLTSIIDQISADKGIWVFLIAAAVAFAVSFVVRQFSFDYVWYAAIAASGIVQIIVAFAAGFMMHTEVDFFAVVFGSLLGIVLAAVLQFMNCAVDYSRKEQLQFEDDRYYYYVKAIPKLTASTGKSKTEGSLGTPDGDDKKVNE